MAIFGRADSACSHFPCDCIDGIIMLHCAATLFNVIGNDLID